MAFLKKVLGFKDFIVVAKKNDGSLSQSEVQDSVIIVNSYNKDAAIKKASNISNENKSYHEEKFNKFETYEQNEWPTLARNYLVYKQEQSVVKVIPPERSMDFLVQFVTDRFDDKTTTSLRSELEALSDADLILLLSNIFNAGFTAMRKLISVTPENEGDIEDWAFHASAISHLTKTLEQAPNIIFESAGSQKLTYAKRDYALASAYEYFAYVKALEFISTNEFMEKYKVYLEALLSFEDAEKYSDIIDQ